MKTFKFTAALLFAATIILGFSSCKKCNGEDPAARIVNEGSEKASVQIKTSGGNTENINNIQPGTSSGYVSYAPGEVVFTATVDSVLFVDTVLNASITTSLSTKTTPLPPRQLTGTIN